MEKLIKSYRHLDLWLIFRDSGAIQFVAKQGEYALAGAELTINKEGTRLDLRPINNLDVWFKHRKHMFVLQQTESMYYAFKLSACDAKLSSTLSLGSRLKSLRSKIFYRAFYNELNAVLSGLILELEDATCNLGSFFYGVDDMLEELHQAEQAQAEAEAQLEQVQANHRAQVSALAQIIAALN